MNALAGSTSSATLAARQCFPISERQSPSTGNLRTLDPGRLLRGYAGAAVLLALEEWQGESSSRSRISRIDDHGADVEFEHARTLLGRRSWSAFPLADSPVYARGSVGNRAYARGLGDGDEGAGVVYSRPR